MSRPLSFTSMIMLETMLKAATTMIRVRIRNMTLRSTSTALKKERLLCCQSIDAQSAAERVVDLAIIGADMVGVGRRMTSRLETALVEIEEDLRRRHAA